MFFHSGFHLECGNATKDQLLECACGQCRLCTICQFGSFSMPCDCTGVMMSLAFWERIGTMRNIQVTKIDIGTIENCDSEPPVTFVPIEPGGGIHTHSARFLPM